MTRTPDEDERRLLDRVGRTLARWVEASDRAIVIGNRAGIIEWTNEAWTRITGRERSELLSKPVVEFLVEAEIDVEVVDFVKTSFLRGTRCEVEMPFTAPDGSLLWIHLDVDPVRDEYGDVSQFVAVAEDVTVRKLEEPAERAASQEILDPGAAAAVQLPRPRAKGVDLAEILGEQIARVRPELPSHIHIDIALEGSLPAVTLDRHQIAGMFARLLRDGAAAMGTDWGTLSVSLGVVEAPGPFASPTFPGRLYLSDLPDSPYVYVEVHDTGRGLGTEEQSDRSFDLAVAHALVRAQHGELLVHSDAGCGTRVLALFPAPP